jgi:hypothetical protein
MARGHSQSTCSIGEIPRWIINERSRADVRMAIAETVMTI